MPRDNSTVRLSIHSQEREDGQIERSSRRSVAGEGWHEGVLTNDCRSACSSHGISGQSLCASNPATGLRRSAEVA